MRKIINILTITVIFFAAMMGRAEKDNSSAAFSDFKLPQYDEKGKLMFILYGRSGYAVGINVNLENVLVDMIRRNMTDIDGIKDLSRLTLYPIDSTRAQVLEFWKGQPHSDALVWSPTAVFDRSANIIKGNDKVMFRSRFIDIDGIGFDGDSKSKTIHLRKDVKVVVRSEMIPKPGKPSADDGQKSDQPTAKNSKQNGKQS